jgi:hypothetical protein
MLRRSCGVLAIAVVVLSMSEALAQRNRYPALRAALHELREARTEIRDIPGPRGGKKVETLQAMDNAAASIELVLDVRGGSFRGVDRNPDYYRQFRDHPRLRAALKDLRDARGELRDARADFRNNRDRALRDVNRAIDVIQYWLDSHRR